MTEIPKFLQEGEFGPHHAPSDRYSEPLSQAKEALQCVSVAALAINPPPVAEGPAGLTITDVVPIAFVHNLKKWSQPQEVVAGAGPFGVTSTPIMSFDGLVRKTGIREGLEAQEATRRVKGAKVYTGLKELWDDRKSGLATLLLQHDASPARALVVRLAVFLQNYKKRSGGGPENLLEQLADLAIAAEDVREDSFLPGMDAPADIRELR